MTSFEIERADYTAPDSALIPLLKLEVKRRLKGKAKMKILYYKLESTVRQIGVLFDSVH